MFKMGNAREHGYEAKQMYVELYKLGNRFSILLPFIYSYFADILLYNAATEGDLSVLLYLVACC